MLDKDQYMVRIRGTQLNHQLHAIRMRWLRWLTRPIVAIWNFLVDSLIYVWSLVQLSWEGMKASYHLACWIPATIGGGVSALIIFISLWLSILLENELLGRIGFILAFLPIAWSYAEIAVLLKFREDTGQNTPIRDIPSKMGNGIRALGILGSYVLISAILIGLLVLLTLLGKIPVAGSSLLALVMIPALLVSALVILSVLMILLGTPIIGAHVLLNISTESSLWKKFMRSTLDLMGIIGQKWTDLLLVGIPATFFALLISIPPLLLFYGSHRLFGAVTSSVLDTPLQSVLDFQSLAGDLEIMEYVSRGIQTFSFAILIGIVCSFAVANYASISYAIYGFRARQNLAKRLLGVLLVLLLLLIPLRLVTGSFFGITDIFGGGDGRPASLPGRKGSRGRR